MNRRHDIREYVMTAMAHGKTPAEIRHEYNKGKHRSKHLSAGIVAGMVYRIRHHSAVGPKGQKPKLVANRNQHTVSISDSMELQLVDVRAEFKLSIPEAIRTVLEWGLEYYALGVDKVEEEL